MKFFYSGGYESMTDKNKLVVKNIPLFFCYFHILSGDNYYFNKEYKIMQAGTKNHQNYPALGFEENSSYNRKIN